MQKKSANHRTNYIGNTGEIDIHQLFDYGDLSKLSHYTDSHPEVLKEWVKKFNWEDLLYPNRPVVQNHKHNRFRYKLLTFIEQNILSGKTLFGFDNYKLLNK
jgi:hypothetical protein